jgi:hypothetical protein
MAVGYLPDMFGHVAQKPQILRRAGIRHPGGWRGVPAAIDRNAFRWRAPDGSEVRAEYLVGGYGNGAYLLAVPDQLGEKVARYVASSRAFYGDRSILAMYGTDHAVPSPRLADIVARVNESQPARGVEIRIETLDTYIRAFDAAIADPAVPDPAPAPVWAGELRSAARANMLSNVTSARIDLKMAAARAELALERYAEPLAALHGAAWPARLLELAWRKVVDNSAHDSICGCSQDAVVDQVLSRFAEAEQIGRGLATTAIRRLAEAAPRGSAIVVNPSPFERADLVELDLDVPAAWDTVELELPDGRRLATQLVDRPETMLRRLSLTGRQLPELFARRLHGRELFGHSLDGHRIDRSGAVPRLTLLVDDPAAPSDFDVDTILDAVAAAAAGASILLDHVTEYELVDGRELALTVLRSTGHISRNDNPFREDPAGPEVPVPDAQLVGPWTFSFAILPGAASWQEAGVLRATEAYRLPFLTAAGRSSDAPRAGTSTVGLRVDGDGVVLSALRRRDGSLEARLVAQTDRPTVARLSGRAIADPYEVDLLGRRLKDMEPAVDGTLDVPLGPWQIRTIRFTDA